jgi:hypothetical protein
VVPRTRGQHAAVTRDVELALGGFAGSALLTQAERHGLTPNELVALAAEHYAGELATPRMASRLPQVLAGDEARDRLKFHVELRPETWRVLERHARDEGASVELVLEHAALQLVADLDAGRAVARVAGP